MHTTLSTLPVHYTEIKDATPEELSLQTKLISLEQGYTSDKISYQALEEGLFELWCHSQRAGARLICPTHQVAMIAGPFQVLCSLCSPAMFEPCSICGVKRVFCTC